MEAAEHNAFAWHEGLGNATWHEELRIEYKGDADGTAERRGIR